MFCMIKKKKKNQCLRRTVPFSKTGLSNWGKPGKLSRESRRPSTALKCRKVGGKTRRKPEKKKKMRSPHMTALGCSCSGSNFSDSSDFGEAPSPRSLATRQSAKPGHVTRAAPAGLGRSGTGGREPRGPAGGPGTCTFPGAESLDSQTFSALTHSRAPWAPLTKALNRGAARGARPYLRHGDCSGPEKRRRDVGLQDRGQRWFPEADPPSAAGDRPPPGVCAPLSPSEGPFPSQARTHQRGTRSRSLRESGECGRAARRSGMPAGRSDRCSSSRQRKHPDRPAPPPGPPRPRPPCACVGRGQAAGGAGAAAAAAVGPRRGAAPEGGAGVGSCPGLPGLRGRGNGGPSRLLGSGARGCLFAGTASHCAKDIFDLGIEKA